MTVNTNIGKITASKEVLNEILLSVYESADSHNKRGKTAIAKREKELCDDIYIALKEKGYYEK